MIYRLIIFLIINFAALGIGSSLMGEGSSSEWYLNLNKAPWTPPGWVFGFAWTSIMLLFAIYMAYLWKAVDSKTNLLLLFTLQLILNISWSPVFFKNYNSLGGLVIIIALTLLMGYFFFHYWGNLRYKSILVLPYFLWLILATSLNAYISIYN